MEAIYSVKKLRKSRTKIYAIIRRLSHRRKSSWKTFISCTKPLYPFIRSVYNAEAASSVCAICLATGSRSSPSSFSALCARYKFSDIRPFVSFEMGQFSRDLMVIAFLGRHIAFHSVQCVRPIYQPPPAPPPRQSSSTSSFPHTKFLLRNCTSPEETRLRRTASPVILRFYLFSFFFLDTQFGETPFSSRDQWSCRCGENRSFQFIA